MNYVRFADLVNTIKALKVYTEEDVIKEILAIWGSDIDNAKAANEI